MLLDEREVSAPQDLSGRCDCGPPRGHRDSAKRCVWAETRWRSRKGINPFTKEPAIFNAKPARKIIRARPVKAAKDAVS